MRIHPFIVHFCVFGLKQEDVTTYFTLPSLFHSHCERFFWFNRVQLQLTHMSSVKRERVDWKHFESYLKSSESDSMIRALKFEKKPPKLFRNDFMQIVFVAAGNKRTYNIITQGYVSKEAQMQTDSLMGLYMFHFISFSCGIILGHCWNN